MNTIIKTGAISLSALVLGGCSFLFPPERMPTIEAVEPVAQTDTETMATDAKDMVVEEMMMEKLGDGETLWSFAARTTGSGFNWGKIAELNGIGEADITKLQAGRELKVPAEMMAK